MVSPRWRKLRGDLIAARGRVALMVLALAVSLAGFGTVLGARAVLQREIAASYLGAQPADATLELPAGVDAGVLAAVRVRPEIAAAAAREVVAARVQTSGGSRPILLFVADDLDTRQVNVVHPVSGAWPPARDALLLEQTSVPVLGTAEGATLTITTPHGAPRPLAVAGVVHDTALAPAWQEHRGSAYLTRETLAALGEPAVLHDLCVRFAPAPATQADAEAAARTLAQALVAAGHPVHQIRVPKLRQHPHAGQMATMQLVLLIFGVLLVVLSAILIATSLAALLARQVREIGVMKAIGARSAQLAAVYAGLVLVIGGLALALALPLAYLGARAFIAGTATALNLAVTDAAIPMWVVAVQIVSGLCVPLALAAIPIARACGRTVRDALDHHGASAPAGAAPTWLPRVARSVLRTPGRLALSSCLLVAAGVMAMTAFNVKRAYEHNLDRMPAMWHYDVDFWLAAPAPASLAPKLAALPGVRVVEPWGDTTAAWLPADAPSTPTAIDIVHTYPDQGHGSFHVYGAPPATTLASLPLAAGRWLTAGDTDAIVMSRGRGIWLGQRVQLSLDGHPSAWTVVGIVDPLPSGSAFVRDAALAAATHTAGQARLFRIGFAPGADPAQTTVALTAALTQAGAAIDLVAPLSLLRGALDDHVLVVSRAAALLAAILALVGLLGLGAAMGISVVERTREIGIMKAIGAPDRRIFRLIVGEAAAVAIASWLVAVLLMLPATLHIDGALGAHGFLAAAFVISPLAIVGWLAIAVLGSLAASYLPARRAARLTVRAALAEP